MRLSYSLAMAALLGYAGSGLAQPPAPPPPPPPASPNAAPANGGPAANGDLANGQSMSVDGNGAPVNHFYVDAEYLLWTMRETPLKSFGVTVPVVFGVVPPAPALPFLFRGDIGIAPSALGLLKSEDLNRNGARLTLGYWLPDCSTAVELSYFQLEKHTFESPFAGTGSFSFPISGGGSATVTENVTGGVFERIDLWGAELNCKERLLVIGCCSLDGLMGIRYINLDEAAGTQGALGLASGTSNTATLVFPPGGFPFSAFISTINHNYLGQVGAEGRVDFGCVWVAGWVKGGVGANDEEAKLFGTGVLPGTATLGRTQMTLMGEANLNIGWQINRYLKFHAGYDWLYLKNVLRAGGQVTTSGSAITLQGSSTAGAAIPFQNIERMKDDKFFAHGYAFGLEFDF